MLPFYARSFQASAFDIGLLMGVYSLLQFFVAPYWGQLSDKVGRRPVLLLTIAGQALAFFVAAFAPTFLILLLSRMLAGAFAANISTANAYMADITSLEDRAKGMGILGAAFGLGFIFGPALGGFLIQYGVEWPSIAAGVLGTLNFVYAFFVLKEPLRDQEKRLANRRRLSWEGINQVLSQTKYFTPTLLFFLFTMAFVQLEICFGLYVLDQFGFSEKQAGYSLAGMGFIMALVQGGLVGKLVKKLGEAKLISMGSVLTVLGLVGIARFESMTLFFVALGVVAIGYSLVNPCLSATISKRAPQDEQGKILGIYQSAASLGRIIAPLSAGFLYDLNIQFPFISGAFLILVGVAIWMGHSSPQPVLKNENRAI